MLNCYLLTQTVLQSWIKVKNVFNKKIDGKEHNTAKGVSIATEFNNFKDVLFHKKIIRYKMKRIQSKKHKLGTYEIEKISLSCFDDKRCVRWWNSYFKLFSQKQCQKL